jgi:hypothetical protein
MNSKGALYRRPFAAPYTADAVLPINLFSSETIRDQLELV